MSALAMVFIGGGCGSLARYGLSRWALDSGREALWGTLLANVLACLALGYLVSLAQTGRPPQDSPQLRLLLATGFCGGFSTFSTFSLEALTLVQSGRTGAALLYVGASVVLGLLAVGVFVWRAA